MLRGPAAGDFVRLGGSQVDDSVVLTGAAALRQGPWQALLLLSPREGHETPNRGTNKSLDSHRTTPKPLSYRKQVALGKVFFSATQAHTLAAAMGRRTYWMPCWPRV